MQVVDAVEVHVFSVPGKRGLPHAKVKVGSVDALDDNAALLLHHVQQGVQMANVPLLNVLKGNHIYYYHHHYFYYYYNGNNQSLFFTSVVAFSFYSVPTRMARE